MVGIPADWKDSAGQFLAANEDNGGGAWFSVHADDYLARGQCPDGLLGKLRDFLSSQGISPNRYTDAYLVTAPRFLGFSFNPVSFWYLYDHKGSLAAMILEVNNTFDERRMYFMQHEPADGQSTTTETFSTAWSKDFHVSPFNDRQGSYSLTAKDLLAKGSGLRLDNNIVLRDEAGKAKLVARIFSTESGVDPYSMSTLQTLAFLARWWWVGFATNLRILREARILWVKKLQVYYRPEVFRTSIGRTETSEEWAIESFLRSFFTDLVNSQQDSSTVINYTPGAGQHRGKPVKLVGHQGGDQAPEDTVVNIHVMTPAFYSQLLRCQSLEQAFNNHFFHTAQGEAMLDISNGDVLLRMLHRYASRQKMDRELTWPMTMKQWTVSVLRKGLAKIPVMNVGSEHVKPKPKPFACSSGLSEFDLYVRSNSQQGLYSTYLNIAIRILVADRIAFGFGWLLNMYRYVFNTIMLTQISRITGSLQHSGHFMGVVMSITIIEVLFHSLNAVF